MSASPEQRPRIIDAVFTPTREVKTVRAVALAVVAAFAIHALFVFVARLPSESLEEWSEEISEYVHEHVVVVERVQYTPPPPPPVAESVPHRVVHAHSRAPVTESTPTPSPAEPSAAPLIDFGDTAIENLPGAAGWGAGGVPGGTGTSAAGVASSDPPSEAVGSERHVTPVALVDDDWNCPWPEGADDAAIDLQTTVVRVVVRANGTAESARAISGAEHGFGAAAVSCAMSHEYAPARDENGVATRRESGPIRITFTRSAQ